MLENEVVRIKFNDSMFAISNLGNIKTGEHLTRAIYRDRNVQKKHKNVVESLENCLYKGKAIRDALYDFSTNEIVLILEGGQEDEN